MANKTITYPPVIDNNIGAWTSDSSTKVLRFYIDSLSEQQGYHKKYVEIKIMVNGYVLKQGVIDYSFDEIEKLYKINLSNIVDEPASLNTAYRFYIQLISANESITHPAFYKMPAGEPKYNGSGWSLSATKYYIKNPQTEIFGGLTEKESYDEYSLIGSQKTNKLITNDSSEPPTANPAPTSEYRIRVDYNPGDLDTDIITKYDLQLTLGLDNSSTGQGVKPIVIEAIKGGFYINPSYSPSRRSFVYQFKTPFEAGKDYTCTVWFETKKGLQIQKQFYISPLAASEEGGQVSETISIERIEKGASLDYAIGLSCTLKSTQTENKIIEFILYRSRGGEEKYSPISITQQEISFAANSVVVQLFDYSAQSGIIYNYKILARYKDIGKDVYLRTTNSDNESVNAVNNLMIFFDDIYLLNGSKVLCIKNNPKLESLKRNVQDVVTPTLGGAYPFVRRNAKQKYATFTLGGMITMQDGYSGAEGSDSLSRGSNTTNNDVSKLVVLNETESLIDFNQYKSVSSSQLERICEQQFRERIVDFLYDDQLLLFKSQEEGNMFIRLSGITLSSEAGLGRMIYSFSATATEVQEANNDNYALMFSSEIAGVIQEQVPQIYSYVAVTNTNSTNTTISGDSTPPLNLVLSEDNEVATGIIIPENTELTINKTIEVAVPSATVTTYDMDTWGCSSEDVPSGMEYFTVETSGEPSVKTINIIDPTDPDLRKIYNYIPPFELEHLEKGGTV